MFGGVWTRIKLEALEKYLVAFNTALSKQHFTRIYIDAFAGTGRCDITVNGDKTSIDGSPFGAGVQWLGLEDRFVLYGGGISFIRAGDTPQPAQDADPDSPVHGPFSNDFRWVTLPDGDGVATRLTEGQAKVFKALWSFKGDPTTAERIMQRAGLDSDKPVDVFKVKARDKGNPEAERPLTAYRTLVMTRQRQGLYWMQCAVPAT